MLNDNTTGLFAKVKQLWAEFVVAAIILTACMLSVLWVFRVPLLQNPDETSHIDYAFSIYSAGRLLNVRKPPSEWNVHPRFEGRKDREGPESTPYDLLSHQYTLYLIDATEFHRLRFHPQEKVAADYGTCSYYQRLNSAAPQSPARLPDLEPRDNPWMVTAYPFLYYAIVAVVQKVMSLFHSGPVWLFLGARLLSTLFLGVSLTLVYVVLRELRLQKKHAVLLTAIVGFFPQTTFVSATVQPDNLTMLLVLLCSYCALRFRRREPDIRLQLVLGVALGALLVTKYHIFLITGVAVLLTVISEHIFRRRSAQSLFRQLLLLLFPSLLLFMVQLWIVWGGPHITGGNLHSANASLFDGIKNALRDYYKGGPAWITWWGTFGWADAYLVIWSPTFQTHVWNVLTGLTLLMCAVVIVRILMVAQLLIKMVSRRHWRMALRLAFGNPLLISYFLFSAFMILLYALTDNSFFAQGRHWFPYTLPGFLMALYYAPRVFRRRDMHRSLSTALMVGLLIYCGIAGYYSLKTITDRYYPPVTANATQ